MKTVKAMVLVAMILKDEEGFNNMVDMYSEKAGINPDEVVENAEEHKKEFEKFVLEWVLENM